MITKQLMHPYCSGEIDSSFVRRTPSYLIHGVEKRVGEVRGGLQYRYITLFGIPI